MSFFCCGVKYSKNDPETYWCIDTDIINAPIKKNVNNKRVIKEVVDTLTCKKNGCLKVQITRYGHDKGKLRKLEVEELKGNRALDFLKETSKIRIRQPLKVPLVSIPKQSKNDFVYGKTLDRETQRRRYLSEQGWASSEKLISKVRFIKNICPHERVLAT